MTPQVNKITAICLQIINNFQTINVIYFGVILIQSGNICQHFSFLILMFILHFRHHHKISKIVEVAIW